MPCHLPYIPTTPRSAAFCAHIHSTRTDHGSWVLFSARKAHELVLLFGVYYNRFDVRERTRTEIRLSAGSSTVAARNHGGGAPTTCTTHDELVQVRLSKGRPSWLSHTAAAPPSWIRLIAAVARARRSRSVCGCVCACLSTRLLCRVPPLVRSRSLSFDLDLARGIEVNRRCLVRTRPWCCARAAAARSAVCSVFGGRGNGAL